MNTKQPAFCQLCGTRLQGSYMVYDNRLTVCQQCNATVPRCSQCNIPSLHLKPVRGVMVCPQCLQKAAVCPVCHIPILRKFYLIGNSPIKYCDDCVQKRPRCEICRVPLDEHGRVISGQGGDVVRCASCLQTAVVRPDEAERLYRETYALLQRELHMSIPFLPQLSLVERSKLLSLNRQADSLVTSNAPVGPGQQHLLGFFQQINGERNIFVEQLLPQTLFRAVCAHELAHAWQSFYASPQQPPLIVEGFAEWAAYRVLLALGQQRDAAQLTRRDDLYGKGLQHFIALERQNGRDAVLKHAQHG